MLNVTFEVNCDIKIGCYHTFELVTTYVALPVAVVSSLSFALGMKAFLLSTPQLNKVGLLFNVGFLMLIISASFMHIVFLITLVFYAIGRPFLLCKTASK